MHLRIPAAWRIHEGEATPEGVYLARRSVLRGLVAAGLAEVGSRAAVQAASEGSRAGEPRPPYPAARNPAYGLDRALTAEAIAARHNIFDEFSGERGQVWQAAAGLVTRPWAVHVGGAVEKPLTIDVDDLVRRLGLEERLYRHRCVENWAMAVPWTGFPFRKLVELARPLAQARFVRMVGLCRPELAPAWNASRRVFPYYEALSLAEATNELALLATGIYGHPLPPQHGAPLRLVVPWKYGLKGIKSITAFQFTEERPGTFWSDLSPGNYSFECNVEPQAERPWPQREEQMLGTGETRKTLLYNGYAEQVAQLYR
jgi:methionine sulfoxide reductase catalytic subunit